MWERDNILLQIASFEKKIVIWEIIVSYTQEVTEGNFKKEVSAQIESKTSEALTDETRLQCWQLSNSTWKYFNVPGDTNVCHYFSVSEFTVFPI